MYYNLKKAKKKHYLILYIDNTLCEMGHIHPTLKEKSVDWDTTENLYIESDNLEVLKLLQRSYHGQVDMIYIENKTQNLTQFNDCPLRGVA